jgi:hypothetical protein
MNDSKYVWWVPICAIAIMILNYLDVVSTVILINEFGLEVEVNPIVRRFVAWSMPIAWMTKIVTITCFALWTVYSVNIARVCGEENYRKSMRNLKILYYIIVPFMLFVVINNFFQVYMFIWRGP